MGLDMYAFRASRKPKAPVDFKDGNAEEIHYWRKHPNLHGWMEELYRAKGGEADVFNCVNVELTADDLDSLERAVKGGDLPPTSGFFFGESDGSEQEDDLAFIASARQALEAGQAVFYSSWW